MNYYSLISSMGKGVLYDADAQLFITNASITNTTQKNAINQLVLDFKTAGIWTKFKAIYPFVGGTAAQHRFNLKDPRTVNAAYYLDFIGGITHSVNGVLFGGATGYADTKLAPNVMGLNSHHMSYYTRLNANTTMGVAVNGYNFLQVLDAITLRGLINLQTFTSSAAATIANRVGFSVANRNSSTNVSLYKNSSKIHSYTPASNLLETYPIYISGLNRNTSVDIGASNEYAFSSIGDGLTDAEALAFYNAVQAYQTTLGRQV